MLLVMSTGDDTMFMYSTLHYILDNHDEIRIYEYELPMLIFLFYRLGCYIQ